MNNVSASRPKPKSRTICPCCRIRAGLVRLHGRCGHCARGGEMPPGRASCRHCDTRMASAPRGLCKRCYMSPAVREATPPFQVQKPKTFMAEVRLPPVLPPASCAPEPLPCDEALWSRARQIGERLVRGPVPWWELDDLEGYVRGTAALCPPGWFLLTAADAAITAEGVAALRLTDANLLRPPKCAGMKAGARLGRGRAFVWRKKKGVAS